MRTKFEDPGDICHSRQNTKEGEQVVMGEFIDVIFKKLNSIFEEGEPFQEVFVYLDQEQIEYFYSELTGLQKIPKAEVESLGGNFKASLIVVSAGVNSKIDRQYDIPMHVIYKSIKPLLKKKVSKANNERDINDCAKSYCWIEGNLRKTNFPDGKESLEIFFDDIHGLLLLNEKNINSIYRPYLSSKAMSDFMVESLVYVHSKVRSRKFNQQPFGDNKIHDWVPITPITITTLGDKK